MNTAKRIIETLIAVKRGNVDVKFPITGAMVFTSSSDLNSAVERLTAVGVKTNSVHRGDKFYLVVKVYNVSQLQVFASVFFGNVFSRSYEAAEVADLQVRRSFKDWVTLNPRPRPHSIKIEVQVAEQKKALKDLGVIV